MKEALWVAGLVSLMVLLGLSRTAADGLLSVGQWVMYGGAAIGVPLEIVYFGALYLALGKTGRRPGDWYSRPFDHHHLLTPDQRWWVLPFYLLGALSFAAATLGIAIVVIAIVGVSFSG